MKYRDNIIAAGYIVACGALALVLSFIADFPHSPQHWSADLVTAKFSPQHKTQSDQIAIVYVDEGTLSRFTYTVPTDRQMLADLVKKIDEAGAKVIGLDFIFDHKTDDAKDRALLDAIKSAKAKIVMGRVGGGVDSETTEGYEKEFLTETGRPSGHLYFNENHSSLRISDEAVRNLATKSIGAAKTASFDEVIADAVNVKPKPSTYVSWLRAPKDGTETFPALSADTVLNVSGKTPPGLVKDLLQNKIVLVGGNFIDRDQHLIPFSVTSHERYPGTFVHAQILSQFLEGRTVNAMPTFLTVLLAMLGTAAGFYAGRWSGNRHMLVEIATVIFLIGLGILTFTAAGVIFPYTTTLLAWVVGAAAAHYGKPHTASH